MNGYECQMGNTKEDMDVEMCKICTRYPCWMVIESVSVVVERDRKQKYKKIKYKIKFK